MDRKAVFLIVFCLFLVSIPGFTRDYYISPSGNDSNTGLSSGNAFKTIDGARRAIQTYISGGMSEDIVVYLSAGTYPVTDTVQFTPADSGKSGYSITYRNIAGSRPLVAGGITVNQSDWQAYASIVYRAYVGTITAVALFENGRAGIRVDNPYGYALTQMVSSLDTPGEFYYDGTQGYLYYNPRYTPIDEQQITIPQVLRIIEFAGESTINRVENIIFSGLSFIGTTYSDLELDSYGDETGLIHMRNTSRITIRECRILGAGVTGVFVCDYAYRNTIENCRIDGSGRNGITLRGHLPGEGGFASAAASDVNKETSVKSCYITATGTHRSTGVGIRIIQSGSNIIESNTIYSTSGSGVHIDGPENIIGLSVYGTTVTNTNKYSFLHARNNIIRKNDISRTGLNATGSGIYTGNAGTGNIFDNNIVHDIYSGNIGGFAAGISIASPSEEVSVVNNILHSIKTSERRGRPLYIAGNDCTISNNIIADNDPTHDFVYDNTRYDGRNLTITNNIASTPGGTFIHYFESWHEYVMTSDENLYYHPYGGYEVRTPYERNSLSTWQQHYDQSSVFDMNPLFIDEGSHNYSLETTSPAFRIDFTDIDQDALGIPKDFPHRYARDLIEAERYNAISGAAGRVTTIRSQSQSDYAGYNSLFFDEQCKNFEIRYSCNTTAGENSGRSISLRLDGPTGTEIGSIALRGTGGEKKYRQENIPVTRITGKHDLFLYFIGGTSTVRVDWFRFYETYVNPVVPAVNAPIVQITSPLDGAVLRSGQDVTITGTARDLDGSITSLVISLNGIDYALPVGTNFSYTWRPYGTGEQSIIVRATDNSGNTGLAQITVNVSNESGSVPVITITQPENNATFKSPLAELAVIATVTDPDGNINSTVLLVDGMIKDSEPEEIDPDTYKLVCPGFELKPGSHHVTVRAIDDTGFQGDHSIEILVTSESCLIAHWTFDSAVGNRAEDSSGNNFPGVLFNINRVEAGINGNCYYFDGNAAVKVMTPLLDSQPQFTIAGWVKPLEFGNRSGLWGQYGVLGFGFFQESLMQVFTYNCGNLEPPYPFGLNTWHHIALTADGSVLRVFYDGVMQDPSAPTPCSTYGSSSSTFNIGGGGIFDPAGNYFKGWIDDVYLYSCALSADEIRILAKKNDNIPPSVRIMEPANKSKIQGPATIEIKIEASDRDGEIEFVEVTANEDHVGPPLYEAPYYFTWAGVPPGDYTITAKAVDNAGGEASASITVTVVQEGQDLLGYWSFDEETGDKAYDRSGNENHGDLKNGAAWTKGISGSAIRFNGHAIVETNKGLFNGLAAFTAAAWVKPSDLHDRSAVLGQDHALIFSINKSDGSSSGENLFTTWTAANIYTGTPYRFPVEEWHHLATVGTGEQFILYIDGKPVRTISQPCSSYGNSEFTFTIGALPVFCQYPGNYFKGIIDEVYLYSSALDEYEIKNLALLNSFNAPEVIITSPEDYSIFSVGEQIEITAAVKDDFIPQLRMEFYVNGTFLAVDETEPYTTSWTSITNGSFNVKAKAITWDGYWSEASVTLTIELTGGESVIDDEDGENVGAEDEETASGDTAEFSDGDRESFYYDTGTDLYDDEESVVSTKHMHSSQRNVYDELVKKDDGNKTGRQDKGEEKGSYDIAATHSFPLGRDEDGNGDPGAGKPEPTPSDVTLAIDRGDIDPVTGELRLWDPYTQNYDGSPLKKPFPVILIIGIILLILAAVAAQVYIIRKMVLKKKAVERQP
ncbi:MAG: right-handed parallel beta-helix repeat-containing protein [Spirochaetales bacterium]|nr:right-handed parallel beta-helix repeat-containing protein [Spirochaetales bacterium]